MSWRYRAIEDGEGGWEICEDFGEAGHTGPVPVYGESLEELLAVLGMMARDIQAQIDAANADKKSASIDTL